MDTARDKAPWKLRALLFRLRPGEFEGIGSSFAFYQVRGKARLGLSASLLSTETPAWVVMDNLPTGSVLPPQQLQVYPVSNVPPAIPHQLHCHLSCSVSLSSLECGIFWH